MELRQSIVWNGTMSELLYPCEGMVDRSVCLLELSFELVILEGRISSRMMMIMMNDGESLLHIFLKCIAL